MMIVWTYLVPINGTPFTVRAMPRGAKILPHVAPSYNHVKFWAEVDDEHMPENRTFVVAGTGQVLPDENLDYIGTSWDGTYAWHLYEIKE